MKKFFVVAGFGHVGSAVFETFAKHYNVAAVDPKIGSTTMRDYPRADGCIVCVPTPATSTRGYDPQYLIRVLHDIEYGMPILIKSTVSPEIVDLLFRTFPRHDITYAPEYLTQANAQVEFACQEIAHMGGINVEFWTEVWRKIIPFCTVREATAKEVVFQKMARNAFLASKVTWFNELKRVCELNGLDYDQIRHMMCDDFRIGESHTQVPGPDGKLGYGGACFPKEVEAILHMSHNEFTLLKSTKKRNKFLRKS